MSRLHVPFGCGSQTLAGTLDTAPGSSGLLIVSGGNEIRSGAFSGQARLAAAIARAGFPVFRFDRRGVGDSDGENRGFRKSKKDIRAASEVFQAMAPGVDRVVAFGNCDAASALMLAKGAGCDALVLSNPWTIEHTSDSGADAAHPPGAVRSRYAAKLRDPREIGRLLRGGVDLGKLARGIGQALRPAPAPTGLGGDMRTGLGEFSGRYRIVLASADRTAQMFDNAWEGDTQHISRCEGADHAYSSASARAWLESEILKVLRA